MTDDTLHGEDNIIQEFLAPLTDGYPGAFGLKDDCATIMPAPGSELVVKTDPVVAGVHFLPDADPADIAWRALAVNVSDLAGKGATPIAYLMALSLPEAPKRSWMAKFAAGLAEAQRAFGCHLIGGDTDRTPGFFSVAITVFGEVPAGRMVRRGTARAGDQIFVTGTLGDAALGLALMKQPSLAQQLGLDESEAGGAMHRFARPSPRLALAPTLRKYASAAMDLSDGLAKDCGRMCAASGVAAQIASAALPVSAALRKAIAQDECWLKAAASTGDDYEVLLTVPGDGAAAFRAETAGLDFPVTRIGEITTGTGIRILRPAGTDLPLGRSGWDHF